MAFFGLTSLGSQSPFEPVKETPLYVFEPSDWQDAFMQTYKPGFSLFSECDEEVEAAHQLLDTAALTYEQLPTMLRHLYKCPKGVDNVPETATQLVLEAFASLQSGEGRVVALSEFLRMAEVLRTRSEQEEIKAQQYAYMKGGLKSREFVSNLELRGTLVKHVRMDKNPKDKALHPITDAQTLGWHKPTTVVERRPTKSCEETKYASAMVKAGVYYY